MGESVADPLVGSLAKLERVDRHLGELRELTKQFTAESYLVSNHFDLQTSELVYSVQNVVSVPPNFSVIIGDITHGLRSALDYLVWQLAQVNGYKATKKTEFPIFLKESDYKNDISRKTQGVPSIALNAIYSVQPFKATTYSAENHPLWLLHELDNIDKHRLLLSVIASSFYFSGNTGPVILDKLRNLGDGSIGAYGTTSAHRSIKRGIVLHEGQELARLKWGGDTSMVKPHSSVTKFDMELCFDDNAGPAKNFGVLHVLDCIQCFVKNDIFGSPHFIDPLFGKPNNG